MGEESEFRGFAAERGDALLRTAYLLVGDWAKAQDLTQTALATTWRHWDSLRALDAAYAYTQRCMARTAQAWWRRKWRAEVPTGSLPDLAGRSPYDDVDVAHTVLAALGTLTRRQRTMVVLRYFDDLPEAEVARLLGCPVGTVKSTTAQALARLRKLDVWEGLRPRPCVVPREGLT